MNVALLIRQYFEFIEVISEIASTENIAIWFAFGASRSAPQRTQNLFIALTVFLSGFPIMPFKALVQHLFHPQYIVGFVPGHARCHCKLQPALPARCFVKIRHQHSPAFLMMKAGTSLPVARHRQTHLATQVSKEAEGRQHVAFRLKLSSSGLLSKTEIAL